MGHKIKSTKPIRYNACPQNKLGLFNDVEHNAGINPREILRKTSYK